MHRNGVFGDESRENSVALDFESVCCGPRLSWQAKETGVAGFRFQEKGWDFARIAS
jgi:hypothetical protein